MGDFDDLLTANRSFAADFDLGGFDGIARAGVAIVTCMDSRIDPLAMVGLKPGDAKMFRNPGGRITPQAMEALILGVHLLNVDRILLVPHTKCAMGKHSEGKLQELITDSAGVDATWQPFGVVDDQVATLRLDIRKVTSHPLIPSTTKVGGFIYDVDTGLLNPVA